MSSRQQRRDTNVRCHRGGGVLRRPQLRADVRGPPRRRDSRLVYVVSIGAAGSSRSRARHVSVLIRTLVLGVVADDRESAIAFQVRFSDIGQ